MDVLSFAGILSVRLPLRNASLIVDLPFSRIGGDAGNGEAIGNLLLGFESGGSTAFHAAIRLPTAGDDLSNFLGFVSDVHRFEAFIPDMTSFKVGVIRRGARPGGITVDFGGSAVGFLPEGGDFEFGLDYGAQLVLRSAFGFTGGIAGRAILTNETGDFDDSTLHEARLLVDYTSNNIRPFAGVTLPLDSDVREDVPYVLRLGVQIRTR